MTITITSLTTVRRFATSLTLLAVVTTASGQTPPIVYTRCPRHGAPVLISGPVLKNGVTTTGTAMVRGVDLQEVLPDTANRNDSFIGPCDVVLRAADGSERVLYSCIATATPERACAAMDPAVSFDATTVAFTVVRGRLDPIEVYATGRLFDPLAENTQPFRVSLPGRKFREFSTEAQLYLVRLADGQTTALPHSAGDFDSGPAFLSNGRLAFTSTRAKAFRTLNGGMTDPKLATQLYVMDLDGKNVEQLSPHSLASELHPIQLVDGRVAVSSWQTFGMQPYRSSTPVNDFHIYVQSPDGANGLAVYGQHLFDRAVNETAAGFETHVSSHFFGQTTDGRLWTSEYYRHNNFGLGLIVGFPLPPEGQEGPSPVEARDAGTSAYRPWGQVNLASWATMTDGDARPMPPPAMRVPGYGDALKYAGKLGHPAGLPGNRLLVTWGLGPCYIGQPDIEAMRRLQSTLGDNPACDPGIYMTPEIPPQTPQWLSHPSRLTEVVNSPDFHEFMARPVVPYRDVYGVDQPAAPPRPEVVSADDHSLEGGTPFGVLGASSILHRETHPIDGIKFEGQVQWGRQGTDTVDYSDDELCGIRILATHPTRRLEIYMPAESTAGERVTILGEFAVRRFQQNGDPHRDALGMPETSFRVRIPAATPYVMQGIDCMGRTLNTDQTWQSLRPGEVRTCNGCHVHSRAATALPFSSTLAGRAGAATVTLGMGEVPLLSGGSGPTVTSRSLRGFGYSIEFERDVMPIFTARCVSCHGPTTAAAGLRLDLPRTLDMRKGVVADQSTWFRLAGDARQDFVAPTAQVLIGVTTPRFLGRPNLSKYVRMLNARGSLLYWKAFNRRTDGRTDAQFPSGALMPGAPNTGQYDVDFGADHPSSITAEELGVLSRWIDTGAMWGPEATKDTIRPVLHLVGDVSDGGVRQLRVGTADVGSGIDLASLRVCVAVNGMPPCGPNLAGRANPAGVISITLATPLVNGRDEVWAEVSDLEGNKTTSQLTVSFMSRQPPAPLPRDAGHLVPADGGTSEGPDAGSNEGVNADGGSRDPTTSPDSVQGRCGCDATPGVAVLALGALMVSARRRRGHL